MESQPQNPEFRNNPENVHTCDQTASGLNCLSRPFPQATSILNFRTSTVIHLV